MKKFWDNLKAFLGIVAVLAVGLITLKWVDPFKKTVKKIKIPFKVKKVPKDTTDADRMRDDRGSLHD